MMSAVFIELSRTEEMIEEKEIKLNDLIEENKALKLELKLRRQQQHRDYVPKPLDL